MEAGIASRIHLGVRIASDRLIAWDQTNVYYLYSNEQLSKHTLNDMVDRNGTPLIVATRSMTWLNNLLQDGFDPFVVLTELRYGTATDCPFTADQHQLIELAIIFNTVGNLYDDVLALRVLDFAGLVVRHVRGYTVNSPLVVEFHWDSFPSYDVAGITQTAVKYHFGISCTERASVSEIVYVGWPSLKPLQGISVMTSHHVRRFIRSYDRLNKAAPRLRNTL